MQGCSAASPHDKSLPQQPSPGSALPQVSPSHGNGHHRRDSERRGHAASPDRGEDPAAVAAGEEFVVRVKAQVMKRDESTGGWLPARGDPWSVVGLLRRRQPRLGSTAAPEHRSGSDAAPPCRPVIEYTIHARRVKDDQELINCRVEAGFVYRVASPTFHHWMAAAGEHRQGLSFLNARDASRFEKHVRRAVAEVNTEEVVEPCPEEIFAAVHLPLVDQHRMLPTDLMSTPPPATVTPPLRCARGATALSVALAQAPPAAQASVPPPPPALQASVPPPPPRQVSPLTTQPLPPSSGGRTTSDAKLHVVVATNNKGGDNQVWIQRQEQQPADSRGSGRLRCTTAGRPDNSGHDTKRRREYSDYRKDYYVQFTKPPVIPDYSETDISLTTKVLDVVANDRGVKPSESLPERTSPPQISVAVPAASAEPKLPTKQKRRRLLPMRKLSSQPLIAAADGRQRCRDCGIYFREANNPKGSCPDGTDASMRAIERLTCAPCVGCVMYHCVDDEDSVETSEPWSCDCSGEGGRRRSAIKWSLLTLLGLVLPCVWCYVPLAACHRSARRNGISGPRHTARK